jgi:hypothetical protein
VRLTRNARPHNVRRRVGARDSTRAIRSSARCASVGAFRHRCWRVSRAAAAKGSAEQCSTGHCAPRRLLWHPRPAGAVRRANKHTSTLADARLPLHSIGCYRPRLPNLLVRLELGIDVHPKLIELIERRDACRGCPQGCTTSRVHGVCRLVSRGHTACYTLARRAPQIDRTLRSVAQLLADRPELGDPRRRDERLEVLELCRLPQPHHRPKHEVHLADPLQHARHRPHLPA